MGRYAQNTSVSVDRTQAEIQRTLSRYGAEQFVQGWDRERAVVGFAMQGRQVRFNLSLPDRENFIRTPTGRARRRDAIDREWEQACRQSWRALALCIKAKLEAVEAGISTFEQEFLAHILLPGGQTVGEYAIPRLAEMYKGGPVVALLPESTGTKKARRLELVSGED